MRNQHLLNALTILVVLAAAGVVLLLLEHRLHRRNLLSIPLRIVVNGIRGKSSTARLIGGALRAAPDSCVMVKTTGTAARAIYPHGREVPIRRPNGEINVLEQVPFVRLAAQVGARVLVAECMAVEPILQEFNQHKMIAGHVVVITNVRMDHVDEMGPTIEDIARSLSRSMPTRGTIVTAETDLDLLGILFHEAKKRSSVLVSVDPESVTDAEMAPFTWITFKANVAIAIAVAALAGVPRQVALTGMYAAAPDPGVLRVEEVYAAGHVVRTANVMAANDPESTVANINMLYERGMIPAGLSLVINCRPDRLERNGQMGGIVAELNPDVVFLVGEPTRSALDAIPAALHERVVELEGDLSGADLRDRIFAELPAEPHHTLAMVGNIHGQGKKLLAALAEADRVPAINPAGEAQTVVIPRFVDDATVVFNQPTYRGFEIDADTQFIPIEVIHPAEASTAVFPAARY